MEKLIKKVKGKKVLSLVLAAIMLVTTFSVAVPTLKLDAGAAGSITTQDGAEIITQTQIVDSSTRTTTYEGYATQFLDGASRPLDIVIPGLDPAQDYVIQGMTYYPERDWMLVTAYHNYDSDNDATQFSSKVFAIDAATGEFVAMFSFLNVDGSTNVDHGGGIAISEHNIYYACGDADRKIAYAPISAIENAPLNTHTVIQLAGEHVFTEVGSVDDGGETAYTAYVCYDNGILWTGNFYDPGVTILGMSVAATDYSVYANEAYKSMVFGYELKGDSSAEEWNNLIGATGTDCQGNPSYAIGLNNAIKDVQYATVDNGKLYLSCSFGTGEGTNSVSLGGMRPYSQLIVADIDLSIAGTKTITISTNTSGGTRSVLAHDIQDYALYDMMPMSEGLCVIEDKIYITFESASNKYLNEAGTLTGNCNYPIDVIWELDPYALMEIEKAEPENSIYYEKVNSHADIVNGEEYIIVYESDEEDPTTQQKILYAFDADGNFKGHKLSKSAADNLKGYDGMVGHPITEYSILKAGEKDALGNTYTRDILYLDNEEKDDVESVRWTLTNIGGTNYSIKNTETYFANCNSFYFDASRITMLPNSATSLLNTIDIGQLVADNGYFYLSNNGAYLWCNDGLNDTYNTNANAFYTAKAGATPIFSGLTETPGTIHCNALSSALTGGSGVPAAEDGKAQAYPDGAFQIYRRVIDSAASTYESRVFTDLNAELQADGTYTVDLETYAISPNHYQYVGERPTDYILVADSSSSTTNKDSTGIIAYSSTDTLSIETMSGSEDDTSDNNGVGVIGYGFSDPAQDIYFKHTDGEYYKLYLAVNTIEFKQIIGITSSFKQRYWIYYVANDGMYYVLQSSKCCSGVDGGVFDPITREEFINHVDNSDSLGDASQYTFYSTKTSNSNRRSEIAFTGPHYRFTINSEFTRMDTIKKAVTDIVDSIGAQNPDNRVALVRYGATTEYFHTANGWTNSVPTDGSDIGAFFIASQVTGEAAAGTLDSTSTQTDNSGIELKLANDIVDYSGVDYSSTGDRNVVVIFLSDGIPGADDDTSNITSAANNVILKAKALKEKGAFVYSVLTGQASVSGFNKKTYMEAVSTKYAAATGMGNDKIGGQSIDGVNYIINLSSCTIDTYLNIGEVAMDEVAVNTSVGLANLDASAILRQELSDSFIIPTDTQPQVSFIEGKFDVIGRFAFSDTATTASGVTCNWDPETPEILTVTGYDYSTQYISKGKTGNKLRIRITGVLPDETKTIQNTPISNTSTTALYQNSTQMSNGVVFKALPTRYFNIPKYTYVLDYGLQLLDTDVNGTLKAVSAGLTKQDVNNYVKTSENGLVAIQSGDQNLLYHTTPTNTTDSGYVLIQRDSGEYDWFEIEVVPASNVYFEETEFATTAGTGTVAWSTATGGTSLTERNLPGEKDVDGYDAAYDNTNTYSNGTTLSASVDSTNKRSKTATVSFAGNGIDIVSACGPTTGMQIINIKNAETGKSVAASIVDTYYADATFSQVPVFSWRGNYGDYTVETTAVYLSTAGALKKSSIKNSLIDTGLVMNSSDDLNVANVQAMLDAAGVEGIDAENLELVWFDDNSVLNGGSGVAPTKKGARADGTESVTLNNYLDGFRIYNPLGSDSSDYAESEQGAVYYNVIDSLVDGTLSNGDLDFTSGTVAFVTGSLADGETLSFSNYESIGPKNELYLQGGASTGVAFNTPVADGGRVMVSLRAVNGTATATINGQSFTINSATEMYYDITDLLTVTDGKANVSIINTGSGILAVNNIKLTNAVATSGLMPLGMDDLETVQYYASAEPVQATVENGVVTPVVEEEAPKQDTSTDNNDTTTDSGETEESFSIFSLIEALLAFIKEILVNSVGSGKLF